MAVHEIQGRVVYVLNRKDARDFCWHKPWIAVSISSDASADHAHKWPTLKEENCIGVLKLDFPDWELPRPDMSIMRQDQMEAEGKVVKKTLKVFNESNANQVLDFFNEKWEQADAMMVHCMAGQSRSPAIAAAIKKIKDGDCKEFFDQKVYSPNLLVFNKLLEVAKIRGEFTFEDKP